jgi:para-nitrobenzyl esterase
VVFVSVNHRLNALGYLDLSAYSDKFKNSGIVGTLDCVEALRWVQNNIAKFGGDPTNVTILGQSGGGEKVSTLACMAEAAGLFNKVFMMSGGYSTATKEAGLANGKKLVDYLGLSDSEVVEKLPTMRYEELYEACVAAGCSWATHIGDASFESPLLDANGNVNKYAAQRTWIIGTAYSEFSGNATLVSAYDLDAYLPNITDEKAIARLTAKYGDRTDRVVDQFGVAYPDHDLCEALYINAMNMTSCMSRWGLIKPNGILEQLSNAGVTVYNYVDTYKFPYFGGTTMHHSGDIGYWFYALDTIGYQVRGDETNAYKVSGNMADALASFVTSGDPSTAKLAWAPFTADEHNTMVFDKKSQVKVDHDAELYRAIVNA